MPRVSDHSVQPAGSQDLARLGAQKYVRLTTFRRTGEPVGSPVWIAPDGARLLVITSATTGKAKRLRHTGRVELVPCDQRGRVADGATPYAASGALRTDPATVKLATDLVMAKYGLMGRLIRLVQSVMRRGSYDAAAVEITLPA